MGYRHFVIIVILFFNGLWQQFNQMDVYFELNPYVGVEILFLGGAENFLIFNVFQQGTQVELYKYIPYKNHISIKTL